MTDRVCFMLNGRREWLPADWILHIGDDGRGEFRITVQRGQDFMPLATALARRDLEITSSKPHVRASL